LQGATQKKASKFLEDELLAMSTENASVGTREWSQAKANAKVNEATSD
jgi:hypothetical protein